MGNAKIWYYPSHSGTVEEIDLGEGLSDLQFDTRVDQSVSEGITGAQSTAQYSSRALVRVVLERFTSASVERSLLALREHLRRGGLCAVAEDSDRAWAAYGTVIPIRGATSTPTLAAPWPYAGVITQSSGVEIEVRGSDPSGIREYTTLTGGPYTGQGAFTIGHSALRFDYREAGCRWVLLRTRAFWPLLRLPIDGRNQPIVTDDHRITHTLDVQLEEATDQLEHWAYVPGTVQTTTVTGHRRTLEAERVGAQPPGNFGLWGQF